MSSDSDHGPASPYTGLPPRAFWRTGVSERAPLDPGGLFTNWQEPNLLLCPRARPAEGCLASSDPAYEADRRLAGDPRGLDTAVARHLDRFEDHSASGGIGLLRQPAATVSPEGLTYDAYREARSGSGPAASTAKRITST